MSQSNNPDGALFNRLRRLSIDEDENNPVNEKKVKNITDHKYLQNKNWYLVQWTNGKEALVNFFDKIIAYHELNKPETDEFLKAIEDSAHFSYAKYDEIILGRVETHINARSYN
ncbi:12608_t:CDS:2 [Gigaspora rosea]|nr:12608_t:CDS:2 [Gigaspora rosea]